MKRMIQLLVLLVALPLAIQAQDWNFKGTLENDRVFGGGVHGLAVDAEGKLWVHPWNDRVMINVDGTDTEFIPILVYNPDGTPADISPIWRLVVDEVEYLLTPPAGKNRGLATDHNGDILASQGGNLFRIDHQTGLATDRRDFGTPLTAVSATADGEIVVAAVLPGQPIWLVDESFADISVVSPLEQNTEFRRTILISPDGNNVYEPAYTTHAIRHHFSEDGVFGEYERIDTTFMAGMDIESAAWHPTTGRMWLSAGSINDQPNRFPDVETNYVLATWYEVDPETQETFASFTWNGYDFDVNPDIRPRGIAFSPEGNEVYVAMFNSSMVQIFTTDPVSIVDSRVEIPEGYVLGQNYPNPFNPTTNIKFSIPEAADVTLKVYDITGREVATLVNQSMGAGTHTAQFNAADVASGMYIYRLVANGFTMSGKMMLVK